MAISSKDLESLWLRYKVEAPLNFFRGFFDMIVAERRDYALMIEAILVKPV